MNDNSDQKRSIRIIVHGKTSGNGQLREGVRLLRELGHSVDVRVTWEAGDTSFFAREAAGSDRIDTVVAAGGDGTINEMVSGLLHSGADKLPALAILPLGTANDFARACDIPADDLLKAFRMVVEMPAREIDVGLCNNWFFVNVATGGFGTDVTVETMPEAKAVLGGAAYLLTGASRLTDIAAREANFTANDFTWSGRFLAMAVGNGRFAGGGLMMCPEAFADDGLLDLWIMPEFPEAGIQQAFTDILKTGLDGFRGHLIHRRLAELTVQSESGLRINLDGEPLDDTEYTFSIQPHRIRLHLPDTAPILSGKSPDHE